MTQLSSGLARLHREESGATMVEYILLIGLIALPLVAILVWYWKDIKTWVTEQYDDIKSGGSTDPHTT